MNPRPTAPAATRAPEREAREARPRSPETNANARESARFRRIFDECFPFVWRTLRRLGVAEAALPDASQRVFWTVARRLDEIAEDDERAFLFGTARRVASDFRRARRPTVPIDEQEPLADARMPAADELVDQKRARELLDSLLDRLADDLREVLILQVGEGMSLGEIARTLGIPQGTAASRLRRAREEFRRALKRKVLAGQHAGGTR